MVRCCCCLLACSVVASSHLLVVACRSRSRRMADDNHSHICPLSTPVFVNITPATCCEPQPEMTCTSSGGERATPSHAQHEPTPSAPAANDAPSCDLPSPSTCHETELIVIPSKWISSPVCASRGVVGGRRATHDQDNDGAVQQWLRQRVPDQREPVASCVLCDLQRHASECHRWMRERGQGGDGAGARVGPLRVGGVFLSHQRLGLDDGRVRHRAHIACRLCCSLSCAGIEHLASEAGGLTLSGTRAARSAAGSRGTSFICQQESCSHTRIIALTHSHSYIDEPILVV